MNNGSHMKCSNCQSALVEDAKFCSQCGTPVTRSEPEAERRQLSVLFCDLVDSTVLSDQLDPEDLRDVTSAYHSVCAEVIEKFGGHVAQYLGDGVLVYFGYPVAGEDDTRRAAQTALGILEGIKTLNIRLQREQDMALNVRIGIHTGPVVVGEVGEGSHRENLALGRTPNVAARVQSFAEPGSAFISDDTYRMVRGYFDCTPMGSHSLKGISEPVQMHRLLGESGAEGRLDAERRSGLTAFTGRAQELDALTACWQRVADRTHSGQTVLVTGEAGIGKSRIVSSFREQVEADSSRVIECACLANYQTSALHPIISIFERALGFRRSTSDADKWAALAALLEGFENIPRDAAHVLARLLSVEPSEDAGTAPAQQPDEILNVVLLLLTTVIQDRPTVFIVEDLHWADPTTRELITRLMEDGRELPLLILLTYRSDSDVSYEASENVTEIPLSRLEEDDVSAMIAQITGNKALPEELLSQLIARCEGVPLFAEEITKAVLDLDVLVEEEHGYELKDALPTDLIPATLQGSLISRLDRLGDAKTVAQRAAVIGREFRLDVLEAVTDMDFRDLQESLTRLMRAELIYQVDDGVDTSFQFKHALIQDAAYQSLLKKSRREQHIRIGMSLSGDFSDLSQQRPELVAHHFENGEDADLAAGWWLRAGQLALAKAAGHEAISHLSKSLEQLSVLPQSRELEERQFRSLIVLVSTLQITDGWASKRLEQALGRAGDLVERLDDNRRRAQLLPHTMSMLTISGKINRALELVPQRLELTTSVGNQNPAVVAAAYSAICVAQLYHGDFDAAIESAETTLSLITPEGNRWLADKAGTAPEVNACMYIAEAWWMRGRFDRAIYYSDRSLAVAREMKHQPSEELAINNQAQFYQLSGDYERVLAVAAETLDLATVRRSAFWAPMIAIYQGWALSAQGNLSEGIEMMRDGLERYRSAGNGITQVHMLAFLAEAFGKNRQWDEALATFAEAEVLSAETGEAYFLPEVHRLRGEVLWERALTGGPTERETAGSLAEQALREALDTARAQHAVSLELRALLSLHRLQRARGNDTTEAHGLVTELLPELEHGVDTADLIEARALLEAG